MLVSIRACLRSCLRTPGFASTAVLTLALGIGLSTAVFTVADALLLRRLPVRDQDRLVTLWGQTRDHRFDNYPLGLDDAREFARRTRSLDQVAFFSYYGATTRPILEGDAISRLAVSLVSGEFFNTLGASPTLGRALRPADDVSGAAPVLVLSYAAWRGKFSGDASILGRRIAMQDDGVTYTIVGVMPQGLDYPRGTDAWAPVVGSTPANKTSFIALNVIGRLRPGAAPANARDELSAFFSRAEARPWQRDLHGVVHTLPQVILGDTKPALLAFAAAAGLLLLITCINVANLLLVRALPREREIAVRSALGGSRTRIVAQLVTENALLAIAGGALGVAVAAIAVRSFVAFAPSDVPRLDEIHLNAVALAGALAITAFAMLLFGLAPAVATSRVDLQRVLRSDVRQSGSRRARRVAEALVAGQIALALLVLSGAGLITRSLIKLERADLSFDGSHLLIGELALAAHQFEGKPAQLALLDRLLPRLEAIPGVRGVSPVVAVPFSGSHGWDGTVATEGQSAAEAAANPMLNMEVVGSSYFATFGIPMVRGRGFTDDDRENARSVVVISQSTAQHYWPGADPLGKQLFAGPGLTDTLTIVGVVPDTRYRDLREGRPSIYFPLRQAFFPFAPTTLAIRTSGAPSDLVSTIRRVIDETAPGVGLASAAPFETFLAEPLAQPRLDTLLLAVFAAAAAILAAVGLFGVMAAMVRQRTREFGVRMALGATARDLQRMTLRRGLLIATPGIVAGLVGALIVNRLLTAMLYDVTPTDAVTLAIVTALLLMIATLASVVPARASTRIDPVIALRAEG